MHRCLALVVTLLLLFASGEDPRNPPSAPNYETPKRELRDDPPPPLRLNNSASGPPDVYLRVPDLGVRHIGLDVENLRANISLAASIAKMVDVHAGVAVGVDKVNISIDNVAARLDLVIRLGSLVDMVNRTMKSLDLNPKLVNVINTVGNVGSSTLQGMGSAVGGALGSTQSGAQRSIDTKGVIMEETIGGDNRVERKVVGDYRKNMVPTGHVTSLSNGHQVKAYRYEEMDALVEIVFDERGEVVRTAVVKAGAEANDDTKVGSKPGGAFAGEL